LRQLHGNQEPPQCQGMNLTDLASVSSHPPAPFTDRLRLAVGAYLTRFKGTSCNRAESDLRCYLAWRAERGLDPLQRSVLYQRLAELTEAQLISQDAGNRYQLTSMG
jgi:hypothetical protein